ncbi:phosphofructokinase [Candidatus Protochlamydia naegleriophila]|uniref:Pyrophosphate--fructose 6-phosphate 1-phosphotransferase n=1 Tax=Candidatus Protochlamydia naegleriophila TaxID=389348 RepID=A0A0U5JDK0_9BACT|nr:diphosphate--fructose-6-phosphate 1-phosphotransferase [Candidatus Protochlamydia naegleriophila]CUI16852.1 phosphofructokinase [Candidatus Protochlamydia naegleriophila]
MASLSPLQRYRLGYEPKLPPILESPSCLVPHPQEGLEAINQDLRQQFPFTADQPVLTFQKGEQQPLRPLKVGVVLSGGQAPGGHNVIAGLFDALKKIHSNSSLIGFCNGPNGIVKNQSIEITEDLLALYRNQGGFDLIGSGRTKIETPEQFEAAEKTVTRLSLDGLVVIGGDDSNTNAAVLAEYFKQSGVKTHVVGVPKTIDGDLKNDYIEVSFGFDTACKIYSEIIGNILKDALSAKKYYHFIKLMGRSASHIALECALQTHPNLTLISEEVADKQLSLKQIVGQIVAMICSRADNGCHYGVILVPEGMIECIPEVKRLIQELNHLLAPVLPHARQLEQLEEHASQLAYLQKYLSESSIQCLLTLPGSIQRQLLLDRDPHGNVQVSKIETERLLIELVDQELRHLKLQGRYKGTFNPQPQFCGYEGRSGLPSNFDCQYCYALGHVAALLLKAGVTGYMSCVKNLTQPVSEWEALGVPIYRMLCREMREGKQKTVIQKALVDLEAAPFQFFAQKREGWVGEDDYRCPGPIQFEGAIDITDCCPLSLSLEKSMARIY